MRGSNISRRAKDMGDASLLSSPVLVDIAGMEVAIFENDAACRKCGYATRLWDCSVGLSIWMVESLVEKSAPNALQPGNFESAEQSQSPLKGRTVLELGAGTALCSLALCAAEPDVEIIASDIDPDALPLIRAAAKRLYASDRMRGRCQGRELRAEIVDMCADVPLPECDLLLASDVCYTTQLATALARRCAEVLARSSTAKVVIADPGRPHRQTLLNALSELGVYANFEDLSSGTNARSVGGAAPTSFASWLADGCIEGVARVRLLSIEDDARTFGVSCMPAMF